MSLLDEAAEQNPVMRECKEYLEAYLEACIEALENPESLLWMTERTLKVCLEQSLEEPDVDPLMEYVQRNLRLVADICWIGICKYEEAEKLV